MSGAIGYTGTNGYNATVGYTGSAGNTVAQVISSLQSAVAADGTHPAGAVYFEDNGNVRSTTRDWEWSYTESQLASRPPREPFLGLRKQHPRRHAAEPRQCPRRGLRRFAR